MRVLSRHIFHEAPSLHTSRLHLIAGTFEMAHAEVHDRAALPKMLQATVPDDWPPPFNDEASAKYFLSYLTEHSDAVGWLMWYFILDDGKSRVVIGNGGFKGQPIDGTVETGYSLLPEFQGQGYGTEAVGALIDWAFSDKRVARIIAETVPELAASQALLRKLGFRQIQSPQPDLLRYELAP